MQQLRVSEKCQPDAEMTLLKQQLAAKEQLISAKDAQLEAVNKEKGEINAQFIQAKTKLALDEPARALGEKLMSNPLFSQV